MTISTHHKHGALNPAILDVLARNNRVAHRLSALMAHCIAMCQLTNDDVTFTILEDIFGDIEEIRSSVLSNHLEIANLVGA